MGGLIGLAILVFDIIAIIDCVQNQQDSGKRILWIILILLLPLVGMILYFLVGKKQ